MVKTIRLAAEIQPDSILDGEGIRTIIWTQGCSHNCFGCQNPQTHSFEGGFLKDIEELKAELKSLEYQDGITLSGGDPLFQIDACLEISKYAKSIGLNVWCYTGFLFEDLLEMSKKNKKLLQLLETIDVLVDGPFLLEQKSYDVVFRGSKNQRILDVKKSLSLKKAYEIPKYSSQKESFVKRECIFV